VETLDEVVGAWAERLAVGSASSLRAIKRLIRAAEQAPLADMLELERTYQTAAVQSADHQRALTAFLEKKPSPFVPHP
jgi:enoyl-CoA hydratase/carnithine racemase